MMAPPDPRSASDRGVDVIDDTPALGPELDAARARVVARDLTVKAFGLLTPVVTALGLSLEALGPVKQLQKRFFSGVPWTRDDDEALADAIGPGVDGLARHELEPGLTLVWGWVDGRFRLRVTSDEPAVPPADDAARGTELGELFDSVVVPEATPSPRTIRFATPPLHVGPGRAFGRGNHDGDPRVGRIFRAFDDVTDVLVGPDFVAVTIARPRRWESLLGPMLRAITDEFAAERGEAPPELEGSPVVASGRGSDPERGAGSRPPRRLARAWADLGSLRADRPEERDRVLAAAHDDDPARRQVAAVLLADAPPGVAARSWTELLGDPSRMVRRSVVDVVVGAGSEELRPLLEHALDDSDAWVRWKALRGLAALGVEASRGAVERRVSDPDFRVRLEAARVLAEESPDR
jgi:hypothetical protein